MTTNLCRHFPFLPQMMKDGYPQAGRLASCCQTWGPCLGHCVFPGASPKATPSKDRDHATPYSLLPLNPGLWEHGSAHSFSDNKKPPNKNPLDFLQHESHDSLRFLPHYPYEEIPNHFPHFLIRNFTGNASTLENGG